MKKFGAVCLALFILTGQGSAQVIKKITVQGVKAGNADAILAVMETKKESEFSPERIKKDVQAVFGLGFFSDVQALRNEIPDCTDPKGCMELIIRVKERPVIKELKFNGLKEVGQGELEGDIELKNDSAFDEYKLKKSVEKIASLYKEKGFGQTKVTYELKENKEENSIQVTFNVSEGRRVIVEKITGPRRSRRPLSGQRWKRPPRACSSSRASSRKTCMKRTLRRSRIITSPKVS
jgi:outer membrane protein insertion porin family